jgi:predicted transposase/invertase (TIGR01784 family)
LARKYKPFQEAAQFHHDFRLTDRESGQVLEQTLAIHTVELGKYNSDERDLDPGDMLGCWLYWLKHAQDYEPAALAKLFPQPGILQATETLLRIAEITEDKAMYDARERAIRDRKWEIESAKREGMIEGEREGLIKGKIETVFMLQGLLYLPHTEEQSLRAMSLEQLEALASDLQEKLRSRTPL